MAYSVISLRDLMEKIGESSCDELFADFLCPLNDDIEYFLKHKAIEFQKLARKASK